MAVAHDTETRFPATDGTTGVNSVDTTTGNRTFSHAGSASAKGAVVTVCCTANTTTITGVLYGGVQMERHGLSNDTSEAGRVEVYVLVVGVPTGTQTVTLQGCTATAKWACCSTVTASIQVGLVCQKDKSTTTSANPQVALATALTTMVYGAYHSGSDAPATAGLSGYTIQRSNDYGTLSAGAFRSTSTVAAGSFSPGVTIVSEDYCCSAVALGEVTTWPSAAVGLVDDYNRANGALGANYGSDPFFDGVSTTFTIVSNAFKVSAAGYASMWRTPETFGPNAQVTIDIAGPATSLSSYVLHARIAQPSGASATGDGYSVQIDPGVGLYYTRWDNGVGTQLGATDSVAELNANGLGTDKLGFDITGSTLQAYHYSCGVWAPYGAPRTDATYTAAGFVGVACNEGAQTATFDNLRAGTLALLRRSRRLRAPAAVQSSGSFN